MLSASSYVYADKFTACVQNIRLPKHACFESHTPLVNGCVDDVLFDAAPNVQQTLSQFVHIFNLCPVDALLHYSTNFVIHRNLDCSVATVPVNIKSGGSLGEGLNCLTVSRAQCAGALSC